MKRTTSTSRRSFLSQAPLLAAPYLIPRRVLGQGNSPGANNRISIGIIGAGERGKQLASNIPASGQILAICDPDERKTSQMLKEYDAKWRVAKDYRSMMDQQEIGHRTASICHLCNITRELGRRLMWDPDNEIFPEDPEANQYLDRSRRTGWQLPAI